MNKLSDEFVKDSLKTKDMSLNESIEYMATGSIIAFIDEHKGCFEIHGDTTTGKLFVLKMCIKQLASDLDVPVDEIMDFLTGSLMSDDEDEPF